MRRPLSFAALVLGIGCGHPAPPSPEQPPCEAPAGCVEPRSVTTPCSRDEDCDDGNACTEDACASGRCGIVDVRSGGTCDTPWGAGSCQEGSCCLVAAVSP